MRSSIKRPTYYRQYVRKDGTLTAKKKTYAPMFVREVTTRFFLFYRVIDETKSYETNEVVYTLERYKEKKTARSPKNYMQYQRKDGSFTKMKEFNDSLRLGEVYRRFGVIPYIVTEETTYGHRSSLYILERY